MSLILEGFTDEQREFIYKLDTKISNIYKDCVKEEFSTPTPKFDKKGFKILNVPSVIMLSEKDMKR